MAVNRYRFFLQNRGSMQQTIVNFIENGQITLTTVPGLSSIKPKDIKEEKGKPLAFFDEITAGYRDLYDLTTSYEIDPYNYNWSKTHIGYFNRNYLMRMMPEFDNPTLKTLAGRVMNSPVDLQSSVHDSDSSLFISQFIKRIEDTSSDFAKFFEQQARRYDGFRNGYQFNIPESLANQVMKYHNQVISQQRYYSMALAEDMELDKYEIIGKLKAYKNFREMYRVMEKYDIEHHKKSILVPELKLEEPVTFETPIKKAENYPSGYQFTIEDLCDDFTFAQQQTTTSKGKQKNIGTIEHKKTK